MSSKKICDPVCRLLTLVGLGGMGKTRLALHIGHTLLERTSAHATFADGIYFVSLAAATDRTELVAAIVEAIGFPDHSAEPPVQQLVSYLMAKKLLLILDNFEHLSSEAPFILDLLRQTSTLTILITSRESLHAQEAWVYALQGLAFPPLQAKPPFIAANPDAESIETSLIEKHDAVQFFKQCAQRAHIGFDLGEALTDVIRICQLVDGLPLAIELAASWLRVMPITDIANEIESGIDILVSRHGDVEARHHSMRVVLEQAWQKLNAREQMIFQRLSIFRGGFQREAAKIVAEASLMELAVFVEKSLLQLTQRGRYQIHELLRQFAAEQMAAQPAEAGTTSQRHGQYYLHYLAERAERLVSSEQRQALNEVGEEIENVRVAWLWAGEHHEVDALAQATESLYEFYWVRRRGLEGQEVFARTLAQLAGEENVLATAKLRMNLLRKQGLFHYFLSDYPTAYQYLNASMDLARRLEQRNELAYALNITGSIAGWCGDIKQALSQLREALEISQALEDARAVADNLKQLAQFTAQRGEYAQASELADESVRISRSHHRPDLLAHSLHVQGTLLFYTGQYDESARLQQEARTLFAGLDHSTGVSLTLSGLSSVAWARGGAALHQAEALCIESLNISRTLGLRLQVARQLANLAYICCDLGKLAPALTYAQEALALADQLSSKIFQTYTLCCLGRIAGKSLDFESGKAHLARATAMATDADLQPLLLLGLVEYATLLAQEATQIETVEAATMRAEALTLPVMAEANPACWHLFQARAGQLRTRLTAELTASVVTSAADRGLKLSPITAASEIQQHEFKRRANGV